MKNKIFKLLFYIILTFFIGSLFVFTIPKNDEYQTLNKIVEVPGYVFIIVWSILYLLMAISIYLINIKNNKIYKNAEKLYFLQLIINSLWTLIFFGFNFYSFSFIWILILIVLVSVMINEFYKINKIAGLINIPYLFWLMFAAILNISIVLLN